MCSTNDVIHVIGQFGHSDFEKSKLHKNLSLHGIEKKSLFACENRFDDETHQIDGGTHDADYPNLKTILFRVLFSV